MCFILFFVVFGLLYVFFVVFLFRFYFLGVVCSGLFCLFYFVIFCDIFVIKDLIKRRDDGFEFGVDQSFGNMISDYLARTIKD